MRTYKSKGRMFAHHGKTPHTPTKETRLDMPETRRYLEMLQNPNGRFSDADAKAEVLSLDALRILGCDDEKIYGRAKEYLLTLENPDWGFSQKPEGESSMDGTFYAVSALKELGVEKKEAADYVLRLHHGNGSFVRDADASLNNPVNGEVKYTSMAVSALKALEHEEKEVFRKAGKFSLKMRHADDGGFGSCDGIFSDSTLENTYYAVNALEELGSIANVNVEKTAKYILGIQNADGGFSPYKAGDVSFASDRAYPRPGKRSDIESTFYAVSSLCRLGALGGKVRRRAGNYVMKLKNDDGSFCHSRSEPGPLGEPPGYGTLLSTAYAVLTLGLLEGKLPP